MTEIAAASQQAASATCGRCGYSVIGLMSLTCPECGGDLRAVGILTPNNPDRSGRYFVMQAVVFTCAYFVAASMFAGPLLELLPKPLEHTRDLQLVSPASGRYKSIHLSTHTRGWAELGAATRPDLRFELEPLAPPSPAIALPPAMTMAVASNPALANSATVLAWLKSAGVDVSDPKVQAEAKYVAAAAREVGRPQPATPGGNFGTSSSGSAPWGSGFGSVSQRGDTRSTLPQAVVLGIGAISLGVWVGGIMLLRARSAVPRDQGPAMS